MTEIRRKLSRLALLWMARRSPTSEVRSLPVHDMVGGAGALQRLDEVRQAVERVSAVSPALMNRISKNLDRFMIVQDLKGSLGWYHADLKACLLAIHHVNTASTDELATTIVHEATHARLERRGLLADEERGEYLERLEDICRKAELRFAAALEEHPA